MPTVFSSNVSWITSAQWSRRTGKLRRIDNSLLSKRRPTAAFDLLQQQNRINEFPEREERIRAIVCTYARVFSCLRLITQNASAFRDMPFPNYWSLADSSGLFGAGLPAFILVLE